MVFLWCYFFFFLSPPFLFFSKVRGSFERLHGNFPPIHYRSWPFFFCGNGRQSIRFSFTVTDDRASVSPPWEELFLSFFFLFLHIKLILFFFSLNQGSATFPRSTPQLADDGQCFFPPYPPPSYLGSPPLCCFERSGATGLSSFLAYQKQPILFFRAVFPTFLEIRCFFSFLRSHPPFFSV